MASDKQLPNSPEDQDHPSLLGRFLGALGRLTLSWLHSGQAQVAFSGRLFILGLWGLRRGHLARRRLMRRLIFVEVYKCFAACFTLLCLLGLMMGVLWSTIWFGVLANIGGASTLASLLITVHLQEINPILTTVVVVMTYGGPMTLELALMKSSREFNSLQLMGIPPEHLLAWPKLIGLLLAFPGMLLLMTITTFLGAYWGIVKAIDLPLIEFISDLALAIEPFHILMLAIKSILISIAIGFFCLYQAWQTPEGDIHQAPAISRRAMSESFVFGTLAEVLVTIFYG